MHAGLDGCGFVPVRALVEDMEQRTNGDEVRGFGGGAAAWAVGGRSCRPAAAPKKQMPCLLRPSQSRLCRLWSEMTRGGISCWMRAASCACGRCRGTAVRRSLWAAPVPSRNSAAACIGLIVWPTLSPFPAVPLPNPLHEPLDAGQEPLPMAVHATSPEKCAAFQQRCRLPWELQHSASPS